MLSQIVQGPQLSTESPSSVQDVALKGLTSLGVDVRLKTTVASQQETSEGRAGVKLSSGQSLQADLYVPTFGVVPNSAYIPTEYLTSDGYVLVDEYLHVKGMANAWAAGDITNIEWKQYKCAEDQATHVSKNIVNVLQKLDPIPYKQTQASGRRSTLSASDGYIDIS